jgi:hypothetical protein
MEGQINPDSSFGKAIMAIASEDLYTTFLDVGTWNGMGTTRCLVLATDGRPDTMIYSVEANRKMYNEAVSNWSSTMPSKLKLMYGKLSKSMLSYEEIVNSPKFKDVQTHFMIHYGQDCYDFSNAPIVDLPNNIDFAILDGGEFCGAADLLRVLKLSPKIIALDDTKCMKNDTNLETLSNSSDWKCMEQSGDRNGWAIFKRTP